MLLSISTMLVYTSPMLAYMGFILVYTSPMLAYMGPMLVMQVLSLFMCNHVGLQVATTCEALITQLTLIGFFSCMSSHMNH